MTAVLPTLPIHDVSRAAQEQAAMHRTRLLLARCRGCRPPCAPMVYEQSRWHAQQQADFLAWLDAGGLMQAYADERERLEQAQHARAAVPAAAPAISSTAPTPCTIENSGMTPLFSAP